jgi:hypothetical protein
LDTKTNDWEFTVTRKFQGGDAVKGTYHASNKMLGLEWNKDSKPGLFQGACIPFFYSLSLRFLDLVNQKLRIFKYAVGTQTTCI